MASPASSHLARPSSTPADSSGLSITSPVPTPAAVPVRRAFGSSARPSFSGSSTPPNAGQAYLSPSPREAARSRSSSSASVTSGNGGYGTGGYGVGGGVTPAWLQAWAPRGEGRGREFLSNTLNGVASVASTVGHDINGFINQAGVAIGTDGFGRPGHHSRPNSFSASSPPPAVLMPPPAPAHTSSAPQLPSSQQVRKPPQPSNLSRLGAGVTSISSSGLGTVDLSPSSPPMQLTLSNSSRPGQSAIPRSSSGPVHHGHARQPSGIVSPALSRSSSAAEAGPSSSRRAMPYKIGFQPSGVRNDRTREFADARREKGADWEKEEGRLGRRWAKLIDIHFNPTLQTLPKSPSNGSITDRRRSLLSIDLDAINPKEVWRGLKNGPNDESRKRVAEQSIVKWEDDAEVKKCRICQASFSLSTRKHHCRLCGRIVCSLAPTPPALLAVQIQLFSPADPEAAANPSTAGTQAALPPGTRREKCSVLLVADWKTGRGEEVDEGFVGWMRTDDEKNGRPGSPSLGAVHAHPTNVLGPNGKPLPQQPQEVQVRGVRVCRDCWAVVSRKQKMQDRLRVTPFQRLYQALRSVQREIEDVMPDYEDELAVLNAANPPIEPSSDVIEVHKTLVSLFSQYDHVVKRIGNLPCTDGGSQQQVQLALTRSAATFVAREMPKVQSLPQLQRRAAAAVAKAKGVDVLETTLAEQLKLEGADDTAAVDAALLLQPLLEQEAQLESYIAEANGQRKYEDAKALAEALADIRREIASVTERAFG